MPVFIKKKEGNQKGYFNLCWQLDLGKKNLIYPINHSHFDTGNDAGLWTVLVVVNSTSEFVFWPKCDNVD